MKTILTFLVLLLITAEVNGQDGQASTYFQQGYSAINNKKYELAIDNFEKAIELDSTGSCGTKHPGFAYSEMGYAYMRLEKYDTAIQLLNRSLELDSTNYNAWQNKAVILNLQGLNGQAIDELSNLISINPGYINAYIQRGFIYNSKGQKEQAKEDFKTALFFNSIKEVLPKDLVKHLKSLIKQIDKGK